MPVFLRELLVSGGLQDGTTFNLTNFDVQTINDRDLGSSFQDVFQINDFTSGRFIVFESLSSTIPVPPLDSDALTSSSLISALFGLANWSEQAGVAVVDDSGLQLFYDLTSARQISQVPEPGTLALLAMGLSGLAYRRFKQRLC